MFRHLFDLTPPITFEDLTLVEIIHNGTAPYDHLLEQWSATSLRQRYEQILERVFEHQSAPASAPRKAASRNLKQPTGMTPARIFRGLGRRVERRLVPPARYGAKWAASKALTLLGLNKPRSRHNRILDDTARVEYAPVMARIARLVPDIVAKKIPRANIQQAFVFDAVEHFAGKRSNARILCVGSFEDSAAAALQRVGYEVEQIDPAINQLDLDRFVRLPTTKPRSYDIIFSTSVLEHVRDDERFVGQIAELLKPGGVAVLTCDFSEGYKVGAPLIPGDFRFYTKFDLSQRLLAGISGCELVDAPRWECRSPDFELGGFRYTFASLVFRKREARDLDADWHALTPPEQARFFCENGYLVIPACLSRDEVREAIAEIARHGLKGTTEDVWQAPFAKHLVTNAKVLMALRAIFGNEIRFFKAAYVETPPRDRAGAEQQRQALHVDYGIGEQEADFRNSAASWVNVAFYLTDLTPEHSPLWVAAGSNRIYSVVPASDLEAFSDSARMVLAKAGDAVLFHSNTVHAASHNFSPVARHALFYSYRPAWAKPVGPVREWPADFVQSFPPEHRGLLNGMNRGL
jgi:SAM-dependent methyltransferase